MALHALNKTAQATPPSQYKEGEWVWLEAKYLTLPYASTKLAPKHHRPFQIMKEISLVAYQLALPRAWMIHNVFHSSLLTRYEETCESRAQFQCPPPELIGNEEEYEVEQIINHCYHGKHHQLQYLIRWKGYSAADDTWEPADQVHANELVRSYHMKYVKEEERHKNQRRTRIKATICSLETCPQPTPPTSPLLSPQASPSIWTLPNHSPSGHLPRPQWSTDRNPSQSPWLSWPFLQSSVSCSSLLAPYVPLLKDTGPQEERSSSSSHKDWLELRKKIKKLAVTIRSNSRPSNNKAKIWQSARRTWLTWKKPISTGLKTLTRGMRSGREEDKHLRGTRKMKDMSLTSSSRFLMVTTPCMSSPLTSSWTASTAWAPLALTSPSTGTSFSHPNASPSKTRENSLIGSSRASPMTLCTQRCTTIQEPRRTGGSQLSSNDITICMLKLLPWSLSKGAWPLPSRQLKSNWTKASIACLAPMPTSSTNYSAPSMRALTSTPSPRGSSPLSPETHATVQLDPDRRVMSQGGLQEGKRTAERQE